MLVPLLLGLLAAVVVVVPAGAQQIVDAEVYQKLQVGVSAQEQGAPQQTAQKTIPPTTTPVGSSGNATVPIDLSVVSGGSASATGSVGYFVGPGQLSASGNFDLSVNGGSATSTAGSGVDEVFALRFFVSSETPYTVTGAVRTSKALESIDRLRCQENGKVLADAVGTSATLGVDLPFIAEGYAHPGEQRVVECAVIKSLAASELIASDAVSLRWNVDVTLGAAPTTTTTTLPGPPLKPKQCRRACRKAAVACRRACTGATKKEKRACRKGCNQRRKACGQGTGCTLP
jgi:hypothetical protein